MATYHGIDWSRAEKREAEIADWVNFCATEYPNHEIIGWVHDGQYIRPQLKPKPPRRISIRLYPTAAEFVAAYYYGAY